MIGPDIRNKYPVRGRRGVAETLALACAFLAGALIAGCGQGEQVEVPAARPAVAQPAGSPTPRPTPAPAHTGPLAVRSDRDSGGRAPGDGHRRASNPNPDTIRNGQSPVQAIAITDARSHLQRDTNGTGHSDGYGYPRAIRISRAPSVRHSCAPGAAFAHPNASGNGDPIFRTDAHAHARADAFAHRDTRSVADTDAHRNTCFVADTDAHRNTCFVADTDAHRAACFIAYAHRHADTIAYAHRHADTFRPARCSDSVHIL